MRDALAAGIMPAGIPSSAEHAITPPNDKFAYKISILQINAAIKLIIAAHFLVTALKIGVARKAVIIVTTVGRVAISTVLESCPGYA